jgi:hypothetical protein
MQGWKIERGGGEIDCFGSYLRTHVLHRPSSSILAKNRSDLTSNNLHLKTKQTKMATWEHSSKLFFLMRS